MRTLLSLILLVASAPQQSRFEDSDFSFVFDVPAGLVRLSDEELARFYEFAPGTRMNVPRAEAPDGKAHHSYYWMDSSGLGREMSLLLSDKPPPFTNPDSFVEAIGKEAGLTVEDKTPLKTPSPNGIRLTGKRVRPDGVELRHVVVYFILGPERYLMLQMYAPSSVWGQVADGFERCLQSLSFPTPERPANAAVGQGAGRRPRSAGRPANEATPGEWDSLEVSGSLVLAAALLLSLFLGGRANP